MRSCLRCGSELTGKSTQKYCSEKCRDAAYSKRVRDNYPERHAAINLKWQNTHKEHHNAWKREWSKNHRESVNKTNRKTRLAKRMNLINLFGGKCVRCGFSDWRALQIDHINGNGTKHRNSLDSYRYYKDILANPSKFQLLCANCNWIKRYENGEHG